MEWTIEELRLPLKYSWAISRNAVSEKTNFIVRCTEGTASWQGECAPNVRYDENPQVILKAWEKIKYRLPKIADIPPDDLVKELNGVPNALKFAITSAYFHRYAEAKGISLYELLGVSKPKPRATAYSLPIMAADSIGSFYRGNNLGRFSILKLKIKNADGYENISELMRVFEGKIMIDANEGWTDVNELLRFIKELDGSRILFVEQPLPASETEGYKELFHKAKIPVWADESVTDHAEFGELKQMFHGINVKLMKAGSYTTATGLLREAKANGMGTMIGCMVETSLGISSALQLESLADYIDLDGFMILKDEPFGMVKERDGELKIN